MNMYFHQLPCIYHPQLNITNFCQDRTYYLQIEQCLMPLCPSCIREHTDYHQQLHTRPSYFNIYQALSQTDTLIMNSICNLEKDKKRNSELIINIAKLTTEIKQKILQAKSITHKIIQQGFIQLEKDTIATMIKINEDLNLFSLRKCDHYQKTIVSNLQQLYDIIEGLKTQTCLADMIYFLKQKRFQVEDLHSQLSQYLYSNENYTPFIEINKQAQSSLAMIITKMFRLDPQQKSSIMGMIMNNSAKTYNIRLDNNINNKYDAYHHISLTPSRLKQLNSLEKGQNKYVKPKNSPYRNFNEYHEQISRNSPSHQEPYFRQIKISQRQKGNSGAGYEYKDKESNNLNDKRNRNQTTMKFSKGLRNKY